MNKILIGLHVPAIDEQFDLFVPIDVPIKELIEIIASGVTEITNEKYVASKCEQLCTREPVGILNPALNLLDYGIKNGTQLYLI